jgi:hypothetical protein
MARGIPETKVWMTSMVAQKSIASGWAQIVNEAAAEMA